MGCPGSGRLAATLPKRFELLDRDLETRFVERLNEYYPTTLGFGALRTKIFA